VAGNILNCKDSTVHCPISYVKFTFACSLSQHELAHWGNDDRLTLLHAYQTSEFHFQRGPEPLGESGRCGSGRRHNAAERENLRGGRVWEWFMRNEGIRRAVNSIFRAA
jgi:hypothetical protein